MTDYWYIVTQSTEWCKPHRAVGSVDWCRRVGPCRAFSDSLYRQAAPGLEGGQTLPGTDDEGGRAEFVQWCQQVAADVEFKRAKGFIIGNEFNIGAERQFQDISIGWVARVIYGHEAAPGDTGNVFQFIRTVNSTARVIVGGIAPQSDERSGNPAYVNTRGQTYAPPDGRSQGSP